MDGALIDSQRLVESEIVDMLLENWKGFENFKRVKAFDVLDDERKYQEQFNSNVLSVGEELCLLQCYINKAMVEYVNTLNVPSEPATMEVIRKIGAMCLRAMENHGSIRRNSIEVSRAKLEEEPVEPTPPPVEEYGEADVSVEPDSQECSGEDCGC